METVHSSDGTRIAFDRVGRGPPVILVGGAIQHRAIDSGTARIAASLSSRFAVFHYDRRGRGDSGDTPPYAVEREVEDLAALVQEAGGSAFVYGMSSGAVLALMTAATGAADISRLALYEPPFIVDDTRGPLPEHYVQTLAELAATGRRGDAVAYFVTEGTGESAETVEVMRGASIWPAMLSVAQTLAYDGAIMEPFMRGTPRPLERWRSLEVPTLVLDGGDSPPHIRTAAWSLADVLPNARYQTLPGQTHRVDPDVLVPVLERFFRDRPA